MRVFLKEQKKHNIDFFFLLIILLLLNLFPPLPFFLILYISLSHTISFFFSSEYFVLLLLLLLLGQALNECAFLYITLIPSYSSFLNNKTHTYLIYEKSLSLFNKKINVFLVINDKYFYEQRDLHFDLILPMQFEQFVSFVLFVLLMKYLYSIELFLIVRKSSRSNRISFPFVFEVHRKLITVYFD